MTAKERYDEIIQKIEELVKNQQLRENAVVDRIAKSQGMTPRDLATVLGFLTGDQLTGYIRSRKYQMVYRFLIEAKNRNMVKSDALKRAIEIAGMKEQSSLNKAFKREFGISPGQAFDQQDATLLTPPKHWDVISGEGVAMVEVEQFEEESEKIYGIDKSLFERCIEINDLKVFYGLSRDYSSVAVKLSEECGLTLEEAFGYVEGFKIERELVLGDDESTDEEINAVSADDWLWNNARNPDMIYCCITCGLTVSSALWTVQELTELGYVPINSQSPLFIRYIGEDDSIHSGFLKKACEYYERHINDTYTDENFEEFIDQIRMGKPIEIAFEAMQYERAMDDFSDLGCTPDDVMVDEVEMAFKKWAEQETDYSGNRFDDHFDPDNPNYY